jgi:large subunit ribosomal protein L17e
MARGHYSKKIDDPSKTSKARGSDLRVHFKNTRETVMALRGMSLRQAQKYLEQVLDHKAAIPFRRFTGGVGRHAQAKVYNATQCRWPKKSVEVVIGLLKNLESNAEVLFSFHLFGQLLFYNSVWKRFSQGLHS